jgi:hypothetical protein
VQQTPGMLALQRLISEIDFPDRYRHQMAHSCTSNVLASTFCEDQAAVSGATVETHEPACPSTATLASPILLLAQRNPIGSTALTVANNQRVPCVMSAPYPAFPTIKSTKKGSDAFRFPGLVCIQIGTVRCFKGKLSTVGYSG